MQTEAAIACDYSLADFVAAQRLHARPTQRDALIIAVSIVLFSLYMVWLADNVLGTLAGLAGGLSLSLAAWWFVLIPWSARRNYARLQSAERKFHFAVTPSGLRQRGPNGELVLPWRDVIFWRANRQTVLLYTAPRRFLLLPTRLRALGFPMAELQDILLSELGRPRM